MNSFLLYVALACACSAGRSPSPSEDLEEIEVFVRSVLAVSGPFDLGQSDRLPVRKDEPAETVDGRLSDELQRFLESLLSVSSAVDRRTLVGLLMDDTLTVDGKCGPHGVFDQLYGGRGHATTDTTRYGQRSLVCVPLRTVDQPDRDPYILGSSSL